MKLTKKQKNCPYCHGLMDLLPGLPDNPSSYTTIEQGNTGKYAEFIYKDGKLEYLIEIDYCPKCGRPLNEEAE